MSSTITLTNTVNWAQPFLSYIPLTSGVSGEPSLSSANTVLQTILGPPFCWRWNRAQASTFTTTVGVQDYQVYIPDFGFLEKVSLTSGATDGVSTTFVLASAPNPAASLMLFLNGLLQKAGDDYTLTGRTVIFASAPAVGASIIAFYRVGSTTAVFVDAQTPTGTINSSNTVFVLGSVPSPASSLNLYLNGMLQKAGGTDYTLVSNTITFVSAPTTGSTLTAFYRTSGSSSIYIDNATPSGAVNGSNKNYTLASTPNPPASLMLYLNGVEQISGTDYTLIANTIVYNSAPRSGDILLASYHISNPANFVSASVPDGATSGSTFEIADIRDSLGQASDRSQPTMVATLLDDNAGNITFRFMNAPDKIYTATILYQKKAPLFASVSQTWSPVPDELSYVYNQGFMAFSAMYAEDSRWVPSLQRFLGSLVGASEGLDEMQKNLFLENWILSSGQSQAYQQKVGLGNTSRGSLK